jgi:succinate dehydrogenase / fumarate reductase flavoprotein subunit
MKASLRSAGSNFVRVPRDAGDATLAPFDGLRNAKGGTPTAVLRLEMQRAMQTYAIAFRTRSILQEKRPTKRPT